MEGLHGMRRFADRGVLVTGGASGFGLATARRFLLEGARVAVIDRNRENLARAVELLRADSAAVRGIPGDVTVAAEVSAAVEEARLWLGRIDVLLNNAGIAIPEDFLSITEAAWDRTLDTNLKSMYLVGHAVARLMVEQGGGAIVNMASTNGLVGEERLAHYNASKGGVVLRTKSMAIDLAPHGIRVNAVGPGFIRTPLTEGAHADFATSGLKG